MGLREHIRLLDRCKCDLCQKEKAKYEQRLKEESEAPMYDKIVFLSKEAEEEWNNAPEGVKKIRDRLLKENIHDTQMRIHKDMEAKMLEDYEKKSVEYWKWTAQHYEWMFIEQRDISSGYRKIIEEQEQMIRDLKLNK